MTSSLGKCADQVRLPWTPRQRPSGERVGLGERGQQIEQQRRAHRTDDGADRCLIIEVATGGNVWQQQMVLDHPNQQLDVAGRESHALGNRSHQAKANFGVVAGIALANVVKQGANDEQIGAAHPGGESGRVGGRFAEVSINGEPVISVALRSAPIRLPLRQDPN